MEALRALLEEQEEERELLLEHARRMFNIPARQPVTLQQQEAARKAIERAKSCLKLPKTHIDTDKRAFYPAKQTYSEWLKSWEIWVTPLHMNQRRIALLDAHESVPRVKSALHATTLTPEYVEAKEDNEWQTMYDLLLSAVKSTQNAKIWTEKLKARFKTEPVTKGTALVTFFNNKVILGDQIRENDEHFDTSPSEIYQTTLRTSKGIKDATYLDTLRNTLDALPLDYTTETERDDHIQTIRQVIERISTRRNRRGESSDTEETTVSEISDKPKTHNICDYCNNSNDNEQKANATKCPGRFGKTYETRDGKQIARNPNCPILIANRRMRELKRRLKDKRDTNNIHFQHFLFELGIFAVQDIRSVEQLRSLKCSQEFAPLLLRGVPVFERSYSSKVFE